MNINTRDEGSAVTGFALVAPLLVLTFIALIVVTSILRERVVLGAAASTAARTAAAYGSSDSLGHVSALKVATDNGMKKADIEFDISHPLSQGVRLVEVTVSSRVTIPWMNRSLTLHQTARAVDEESLL